MMHYIKIFHGFNGDISKYYTYEYFNTEEAAKKWYEDYFMPLHYDVDLCYMVSHGEAAFNKIGQLEPVKE